jgi:uncharacterized membrane protein YcaP (DUF421 family)
MNLWNNLTQPDINPFNLVIRGTVVYLAVLILLRVSGKRQVGQMGATELVAVLLISNAVQNSMNGGDNSLVGGLILAAVLVALSNSITFLTYRSRTFAALFEGTPRLLIHDGKYLEKNLRKERLSQAELRSLLRKQGVHHVTEVKSAILEADGVLSILRYSDLTVEAANPLNRPL